MRNEPPIHIIDDEPDMCRSLGVLLLTRGYPSTSHPSADSFLMGMGDAPVGIIICDVRMPGLSGIEFVRRMRGAGRRDAIIIITGHADVPLAVEAMKAGAIEFIEKPFDAVTMISAIAAARDGLIGELQAGSGLEHLTRRERQVLELVSSGMTSKQAARTLSISHRTVETYRNKLLEKTGASNTAELVRIGARLAS